MSAAKVEKDSMLVQELTEIGRRCVGRCDYIGSNAIYTQGEVENGLEWLDCAMANPRAALHDIQMRGAGIAPRTVLRFDAEIVAVLRRYRRHHPVKWGTLTARF